MAHGWRRAPRGRHGLLGPGLVPVAVALLTALVLTGVGWYAVDHTRRTVQAQAEQLVRASADGSARAVARQSEDFTRTVEAYASDPQVGAALAGPTPAGLAALQGRMSALARGKDSPAAFVTDLRGVILAAYPPQPELVGKAFSYRDWFKGAARTGGPYVSVAYRSAAIGHPLVVGVAAPVVAGSRRVGYLTVLWQLASVRQVAESTQRDAGITVSVTDQAGQVLTDALAVDQRGQPQAGPVPPTTRRALAGASSNGVVDGRLVAARPVPELGWTVTASRPLSEALAPAHQLREGVWQVLGLALLAVLALTGLSVAVARRRAVEQAAAEEERERLATLFAASPVGILEGRLDGTVVAANQAMADMLGYSVDELLALPAPALAHPDSRPDIAGALQRVLDGSTSSYTSERVYRAKDGSPVPALVSVVARRDEHGQVSTLVAFVADLREQVAATAALRELTDRIAEREAFLETLFDTIDVAVLACDAEGRLTLVNRRARGLNGFDEHLPPEELPEIVLQLPDGQPLPFSRSPLVRALTEGEVRGAEVVVPARDGRPEVQLLAHSRCLTGPGGEVVGAVVAANDVTAMKQAQAALQASEQRFRRVFDEGLTGKLLVSADGLVVRANGTLCRLLGRSEQELVGRPLAECFADPADQAQVRAVLEAQDEELHGEMRLSGSSGEELWGSVALVRVEEQGGRQILLAQVEDVTARRRAERRLTELALHDELTGLPNRRLLLERCDRAFVAARSGRSGSSVAALFVDLDGFKAVNDSGGHDVGDQLLVAIARDLERVVRPTDTVARIGGDEFVVLLDQDDGLAYLRTVADRVGTTVRRQVMVDGVALPVSASVGVARVDLRHEPEVQPEQLLRRADAAMYRAKERGRDRHDVFDIDLKDHTEVRRSLERSVRDCLAQGRVAVVFQPVVDVDSGLVVGAEALVRLRDAHGHLLPTLPSVAVAEAAGLADVLGERVLDLALSAAQTWPEDLTVAVNVSARELGGRDLRGRVEQALRRVRFDPARLVLEITESSILRASHSALTELERLREQGVRVAVDDFGTAYATLANLTSLPVDALKVDAMFTAGLPHQRVHSAVVHGVASIAYELDIPCIVEGVETPEQLEALRGMAVQAQGWIWGEPQGPEHVPSARVVPSPRTPAPPSRPSLREP